MFIEQIRKRPDLTFMLETHSEHLLLRFLRRIRETTENGVQRLVPQEALDAQKLTPDDLAINFIEQGEEGLSCLPIRVDADGDLIDQWPHGFFEERIEELF